MKSDTLYNHEQRIDSALASLWSSAECFGMSHEKILERKAEIMKSAPKRMPQHSLRWIHGRDSMRFELAYRFQLEWVLVQRADGKRITSWNDTTESERQEFRDGKREGFHAWKRNGRRF